MTLVSLISDCIDIGQKTIYQIWDIVRCASIIIRSVVTAIEYIGIKDGHVVESGPFATTCRQMIFVGYQVSDITSGLSDVLEDLQLRNNATALNNVIAELGITHEGKIAPDAIIRRWLQKQRSEVPPTTIDLESIHWKNLLNQMYTQKQNAQVVEEKSLTDPISKLDQTI